MYGVFNIFATQGPWMYLYRYCHHISLFLFIFYSMVLPPSVWPQVGDRSLPVTMAKRVDMCLLCHKDTPGKAHAREVVSCSDCHLGDSLSSDKFEAHRGMVLNPGELKYAALTCGRPGCHSKQVEWVKNTLMATNRGILSTLKYYWGEARDRRADITVEDLMSRGQRSIAEDYFSKLCGTCHLWLERGKHPGFLGEKGGGCSACHLIYGNNKKKGIEKAHPRLVRNIPIENCVRCHNRSGRIGLSYQGMYETEGYGTPFEGGDFTENELSDGRYFRTMVPDIHYEKAMLCVDCHTQKETMGDGKKRAHMEEQLEVECADCHDTSRYEAAKKKGLHLEKKGERLFLKRKKDDASLEVRLLDPKRCRDKDHESLSCQACHSRWVPQCYGCHVVRRAQEQQTDWLAGKTTYGKWMEYRSFMRYEAPSLGVLEDVKKGEKEIVILVPG